MVGRGGCWLRGDRKDAGCGGVEEAEGAMFCAGGAVGEVDGVAEGLEGVEMWVLSRR